MRSTLLIAGGGCERGWGVHTPPRVHVVHTQHTRAAVTPYAPQASSARSHQGKSKQARCSKDTPGKRVALRPLGATYGTMHLTRLALKLTVEDASVKGACPLRTGSCGWLAACLDTQNALACVTLVSHQGQAPR